MAAYVAIVGAVIGAGAAIYAADKAEKTAEKSATQQRQMTAAKNKADMELGVERAAGDRARASSDADKMNQANNNAMSQAESSEDRMRDENIRAREEQKRLAKQQGEVKYASKFKPGQGGEGLGSADDFLVPKFEADTGVQVGDGNSNPLGFEV